MNLSESYFEERWWEICQRMLTVTLVDSNYHDKCIILFAEQCGFDNINTFIYHECDALGINMDIKFGIYADEERYMSRVHYGDYSENQDYRDYETYNEYDSDEEPYEFFVEDGEHVKSYYIEINIRSYKKEQKYKVSLTLEMEHLPSRGCNIPDIMNTLKRKAKKYPDFFKNIPSKFKTSRYYPYRHRL